MTAPTTGPAKLFIPPMRVTKIGCADVVQCIKSGNVPRSTMTNIAPA
jgi:hypothetical protein